MKRIYITFGGKAFDEQTELVHQRYRQMGADDLWVYDDRWLVESDFYRDNKWIFDRKPKMGFGWCSWKPYIIRHALYRAAEGDIVLYADGDCFPIAPLDFLYDYTFENGIMLFEEQGCNNGMWTRTEAWTAMGFDHVIPESQQAVGRYQMFRKGGSPACPPEFIDLFLWEWQRYSLDPRCQFHDPSPTAQDHETFIRNSAEQSVLSLLALKYEVPLHRTPDQQGWPVAHNGTFKPEDSYPQLFIQRGEHGPKGDLSGSRFRNVP